MQRRRHFGFREQENLAVVRNFSCRKEEISAVEEKKSHLQRGRNLGYKEEEMVAIDKKKSWLQKRRNICCKDKTLLQRKEIMAIEKKKSQLQRRRNLHCSCLTLRYDCTENGCTVILNLLKKDLGRSNLCSSHPNKPISSFCGDSKLYPSSLNYRLQNIDGHNERKVEVPLFLTIQFATEIECGSRCQRSHHYSW